LAGQRLLVGGWWWRPRWFPAAGLRAGRPCGAAPGGLGICRGGSRVAGEQLEEERSA